MAAAHNTVTPSVAGDQEAADDTWVQAMLFASSHVFPMVLKAAARLGVFDILARAGPGARVPAAEVASQLATQSSEAAPKLDRMLRLLASHSLLSCEVRERDDGRAVERLYGLTPAARFFVNEGEEGSLASLLELSLHPAAQQVWLQLDDHILKGGNQFKKVHGISIFEYMDSDPAFNNTFNKAMASMTSIIMRKILEIYRGFEDLTTLVDVAGGTGKCLNMVISKYPSIKGINFDLPHVVESAPSYSGIQHVGGSMFSTIPNADAIMIKDTLHNWNDENCIKVLKNCYEALPSKGKAIVIDLVLPEVPGASLESMYASRLDNTMLMQPGGQERTEREFRALAEAAGFSDLKVACAASNLWMVMELYK
ncbi:caffeic acid 3-O-methyltransferase-like [Rhodamnia argentea]|uniref:Caffeic acid 3-O-methyltransferase-like n=1 Tax=Rhodamnia argentea TaxID=178133 RepID=A0A8B8PJL7_9MYRT|nr:caffeic acid 3-O-methyltransferase-like [Rhodamnia argentea]XP_030534990.1 caffeic acid 3-O-methyltransferase-like [Rhodamnia argentea]